MKLLLAVVLGVAVAEDCLLQVGTRLVVGDGGEAKCEKCPQHTFGQAVEGETDPLAMFVCTPCPAGTYTFVLGSITCQKNYCPAGTRKVAHSTSCQDCPKGTWSAQGANECTKCADGTTTLETATSAADCITPAMCDESNLGWDHASSSCVECPVNQHSGAGNNFVCGPCPANQVRGAGEAVCHDTPCEAGQTFNTATKSCDDCPMGTIEVAGACEPCPAGRNAFPKSTVCKINNCKPGYFAYEQAGDTFGCEYCLDANTYTSHSGAMECKACPENTYTTKTRGNTHCERSDCTLGQFTLNGVCQNCPKGTYSDVLGATNCKPCAAGKFSFNSGGQSAAACDADSTCAKGSYQTKTRGECKQCEAGKYTARVGLATCEACEQGQWSWGQGNQGCSALADCDPGQHYSGLGGRCVKCEPGRFNPEPNRAECAKCPFGKYQPEQGKNSCKVNNCKAGRYCNGGDCSSLPLAGCVKCDQGSYGARDGQDACQTCPDGLVAHMRGMTACVKPSCPAGQSENTERTACVNCVAGTFSAKAGSLSCDGTCKAGEDNHNFADGQRVACQKTVEPVQPNSAGAIDYHVCSGPKAQKKWLLGCEWKKETGNKLDSQHERTATDLSGATMSAEWASQKHLAGYPDRRLMQIEFLPNSGGSAVDLPMGEPSIYEQQQLSDKKSPHRYFEDIKTRGHYSLHVTHHGQEYGGNQFGGRLMAHRCGIVQVAGDVTQGGHKAGHECKCWCWSADKAARSPELSGDETHKALRYHTGTAPIAQSDRASFGEEHDLITPQGAL